MKFLDPIMTMIRDDCFRSRLLRLVLFLLCLNLLLHHLRAPRFPLPKDGLSSFLNTSLCFDFVDPSLRIPFSFFNDIPLAFHSHF